MMIDAPLFSAIKVAFDVRQLKEFCQLAKRHFQHYQEDRDADSDFWWLCVENLDVEKTTKLEGQLNKKLKGDKPSDIGV